MHLHVVRMLSLLVCRTGGSAAAGQHGHTRSPPSPASGNPTHRDPIHCVPTQRTMLLPLQANMGPNTNTAHFSIMMNPAPHLDGHYTIFGGLPRPALLRVTMHSTVCQLGCRAGLTGMHARAASGLRAALPLGNERQAGQPCLALTLCHAASAVLRRPCHDLWPTLAWHAGQVVSGFDVVDAINALSKGGLLHRQRRLSFLCCVLGCCLCTACAARGRTSTCSVLVCLHAVIHPAVGCGLARQQSMLDSIAIDSTCTDGTLFVMHLPAPLYSLLQASQTTRPRQQTARKSWTAGSYARERLCPT